MHSQKESARELLPWELSTIPTFTHAAAVRKEFCVAIASGAPARAAHAITSSVGAWYTTAEHQQCLGRLYTAMVCLSVTVAYWHSACVKMVYDSSRRMKHQQPQHEMVTVVYGVMLAWFRSGCDDVDPPVLAGASAISPT